MSDQPVDFAALGPTLGQRFPDITLTGADGRPVDLHEARGHRRALVVFHRSARW